MRSTCKVWLQSVALLFSVALLGAIGVSASEDARALAIAKLSRLHDRMGLVAHELLVSRRTANATFPIVARLRYANVPLFEFNSSQMLPDAAKAVDELAVLFNADKELASVLVVGHTDSIGGSGVNYNLGLDRARTVVSHLVAKGVNPIIIEAISLGMEYPAVSNSTEIGRSQNRRVEFFLSSRPSAKDVLPDIDFNPCHKVDHDKSLPCPPELPKQVRVYRPDGSGTLRDTGVSVTIGQRPANPAVERPIRRSPVEEPIVRPSPND